MKTKHGTVLLIVALMIVVASVHSTVAAESRGWRSGKFLTNKVETAGNPVSIRLTPDRATLFADGEDVCMVTAEAFDAEGREVPIADKLIRFEYSGEGKIIGVGNGNPSSHEADKYVSGQYQRRLFNGKCQVILQSTRTTGAVELTASSDGLKRERLTIRTESRRPRPYLE